MSRVHQQLDKFLDLHHRKGAPVLLGFSGGPDSTAMLYGLHALTHKHSLALTVVHIDHGWRKESSEEADLLKKRVDELGIRCLVVRLPVEEDHSNREEKAREQRLKVFQNLYQENGAQALILGHQAGDQAETALKRLFEGSHIGSLGGMRPVSVLDGMQIWRPFLMIPKKELVRYCQENNAEFLHDYTNEDPRYLRARMRTEVLPMLEQSFGKAIEENLCRLAESSQEVNEYMAIKTHSIIETAKRTEQEISIDLNGLHPFEMQFVIRQLAFSKGVMLGQQHIKHLVQLLQSGAVNRTFLMGKCTFLVNRGQLILFSEVVNQSERLFELNE